jgi:hypothetical protein
MRKSADEKDTMLCVFLMNQWKKEISALEC